MTRMVNIGILNASSKSESQILGYKQDIEIRIFCCVNKAQVLLLFTKLLFWYKFQCNDFAVTVVDNSIYEHIPLVYTVCH